MNRHATQGLTLVELLIAMLILGVVMTALTQFFVSTNREYASQRHISDLGQNVEVATALLRSDLRTAGYSGGPAEFDAAPTTKQVDATRRPAYLEQATKWPFISSDATVSADTLRVTESTKSCHASTGCDIIQVTRVQTIASDAYTLQQIRYTAKAESSSGPLSLYRGTRTFNCPVTFSSGVLTFSACVPGALTDEIAVEGIEDFQVFFGNNDGTYTTAPAINVTSGGVTTNKTVSVAVYLRVRGSQLDQTVTTGTYPSMTWPGSKTAADLGIPASPDPAYAGNELKYRRSERLLTVAFLNKQSVK